MTRNKHYGLIIMVDILGAKVDDIPTAQWLLDNIAVLQNELTILSEKIRESRPTLFEQCQFYVLGDTFIITTNNKERDDGYLVYNGTSILEVIFQIFIEKRLPIRGAVSVGDYLVSETGMTLIGPAISDAGRFCESADWTGIILTENAGNAYREHCMKLNGRFYIDYFVYYDVPSTKQKGQTKKLWCYPWPLSMFPGTYDDFDYSVGEGHKGGPNLKLMQNSHKLLSPVHTKNAFDEFVNSSGRSMKEIAPSKYRNSSLFFDFVFSLWETNKESFLTYEEI